MHMTVVSPARAATVATLAWTKVHAEDRRECHVSLCPLDSASRVPELSSVLSLA